MPLKFIFCWVDHATWLRLITSPSLLVPTTVIRSSWAPLLVSLLQAPVAFIFRLTTIPTHPILAFDFCRHAPFLIRSLPFLLVITLFLTVCFCSYPASEESEKLVWTLTLVTTRSYSTVI